jgi:hypothetical protein
MTPAVVAVLKEFLTQSEILLRSRDEEQNQQSDTESPMTGLTSFSAAPENSPASDVEAEGNRGLEPDGAKPRSQIETDAERIKSAVAKLTSTSIDGLEGLASELQNLQHFLKCEVERVQGEIESALAGITIIVETIAPWKALSLPSAPPGPRPVRMGPASNIESAQSRR